MACEQWLERISALADGELPPSEVAHVEEHLAMCVACQKELDHFRENASRFVDRFASSRAGEGFVERVMKAIPLHSPQKDTEARPGWWEQLLGSFEFRIAPLVQAAAGCAFACVLAALFFPVFAKTREKARPSQCMSNIKNLALALRMYASDYEERLPPLEDWAARCQVYIKNKEVLMCPNWNRLPKDSDQLSYALSAAVAGKLESEIADPANTIMLYEAYPDGSPNWDRHSDQVPGDIMMVAFADGHAKLINRNSGFKLIPGFTDRTPRSRDNAQKAGRKVSYSGKAQVEVTKAKAALIRAEQIVEDGGGFLLKTELKQCEDHAEPVRFQAELSARLPAENFFAVINKLCEVGDTTYRLVEGADLTEQFANSHSVIAQQQESQGELTQVLSRSLQAPRKLAEGSETSHSLEAQRSLHTARATAGEKRHELRGLQMKYVLAALTLSLNEPEAKPVAAKWTFGAALDGAVSSLRGTGQVLATLVIWWLVYAPLWLPIVWLGIRMKHVWQPLRTPNPEP